MEPTFDEEFFKAVRIMRQKQKRAADSKTKSAESVAQLAEEYVDRLIETHEADLKKLARYRNMTEAPLLSL